MKSLLGTLLVVILTFAYTLSAGANDGNVISGIHSPADFLKLVDNVNKLANRNSQLIKFDDNQLPVNIAKKFIDDFNSAERVEQIQKFLDQNNPNNNDTVALFKAYAEDYALVKSVNEYRFPDRICEAAICLPNEDDFAEFFDEEKLKKWLQQHACSVAICLGAEESTYYLDTNTFLALLKNSPCKDAVCVNDELENIEIGMEQDLLEKILECQAAICLDELANLNDENQEEDECEDNGQNNCDGENDEVEEEDQREADNREQDEEQASPETKETQTIIAHGTKNDFVKESESVRSFEGLVTVITTFKDGTHEVDFYRGKLVSDSSLVSVAKLFSHGRVWRGAFGDGEEHSEVVSYFHRKNVTTKVPCSQCFIGLTPLSD